VGDVATTTTHFGVEILSFFLPFREDPIAKVLILIREKNGRSI